MAAPRYGPPPAPPRSASSRRERSGWHLALVAIAVLAILVATLTPQTGRSNPRPWYHVLNHPGDLADVLLNLVLFAPLGFSLALARVRRSTSVLLAAALSTGVELLQFFVVSGRQAGISDLFANTSGALLGHVLLSLAHAATFAEPRLARRLLRVHALVWMGATILLSTLLKPGMSREAYGAECGGPPAQPRCFYGRYLTGPLLRQPDEPDVLLRPGRAAVVGSTPTLVARVVSKEVPFTHSQIAALRVAGERHFLTLQQRAHRLVLMAGTRGAAIGLRTPALHIDGVFLRQEAELEISGGVEGNLRWMELNGRRVEMLLSPADVWRLFSPWDILPAGRLVLVGLLFHSVIALPLGFWIVRAERVPVLPAIEAILPVAAGLTLGWIATGLAPPGWHAWAGVALGVASGALVALALGARRSRGVRSRRRSRSGGSHRRADAPPERR